MHPLTRFAQLGQWGRGHCSKWQAAAVNHGGQTLPSACAALAVDFNAGLQSLRPGRHRLAGDFSTSTYSALWVTRHSADPTEPRRRPGLVSSSRVRWDGLPSARQAHLISLPLSLFPLPQVRCGPEPRDPGFMNRLNRRTELMGAWQATGNPNPPDVFRWPHRAPPGPWKAPWRVLEGWASACRGPSPVVFYGFQMAPEFSVSARALLLLLGVPEHAAGLCGPSQEGRPWTARRGAERHRFC